MPHTLIKDRVDVPPWPGIVNSVDKNREVAVGNLGGNAMRLMYVLIKQGIAQVDEKSYNGLVEICKKPVDKLKKEDLVTFNMLLDGIIFNKALVRLTGDTLKPGGNEYFILNILRKLNEKHLSVEIIFSQSGRVILDLYNTYEATKRHITDDNIPLDMCYSSDNLDYLVKKELVTIAEILTMAEVYKSNLKIISYALNDQKSEITIFSHVGIDPEIIQKIAQHFQIPYEDSSPMELAQTINNINTKFQEWVQNPTVKLYPESHWIYNDTDFKNPLVRAMVLDDGFVNRPSPQNGYNWVYVHGGGAVYPENQATYYNLDINTNTASYVVLNTSSQSKAAAENLANVSVATPQQSTAGGKPQELDKGLEEVVPQKPISANLQTMLPLILTEFNQSFQEQLQEFKKKEEDLRNRGHIDAANAVKTIHHVINESYNQNLFKNFEQFKSECEKIIEEKRAPLENHRGCGLILKYLMAIATGIGAFIVLADLIYKNSTGKHFSFFQTHTAKQVDNLKDTVNKMALRI